MRRIRRVVLSIVATMGLATSAVVLTSPNPAAADAVSTAVSWVEQQVGSTTLDPGLCLTFVFAAYTDAGVNLRSYVTVPITSNTYPVDIWGDFSQGTTGNGASPPPGALVFFASNTGDRTLSHVAISVGNGTMVSTTDAINDSQSCDPLPAPLLSVGARAERYFAGASRACRCIRVERIDNVINSPRSQSPERTDVFG